MANFKKVRRFAAALSAMAIVLSLSACGETDVPEVSDDEAGGQLHADPPDGPCVGSGKHHREIHARLGKGRSGH